MSLLEQVRKISADKQESIKKEILDNLPDILLDIDERIMTQAEKGFKSHHFCIHDSYRSTDGYPDHSNRRVLIKMVSAHYRNLGFECRHDSETEASFVGISW